jgi:hypothetical protein
MPLRMQKFATMSFRLGRGAGGGNNGLAKWLQSSIDARPITSEDALFIAVLAISASFQSLFPSSGALTCCDTYPRPLLRYYLPSPLAGRGLSFVYEKNPGLPSCRLDQVSDQDIRQGRRGSIDRAEPTFPEGISW